MVFKYLLLLNIFFYLNLSTFDRELEKIIFVKVRQLKSSNDVTLNEKTINLF